MCQLGPCLYVTIHIPCQGLYPTVVRPLITKSEYKVNGRNFGHTWVTPDSDSSCSESAAADAPAGGKASPPPHEASFTGGGVGGGRFAARTVAVRSYPHVRSSPHLPYLFPNLSFAALFHVEYSSYDSLVWHTRVFYLVVMIEHIVDWNIPTRLSGERPIIHGVRLSVAYSTQRLSVIRNSEAVRYSGAVNQYFVYGNSGWYIHGSPLFGGGPLLGRSVIGGSTVLARSYRQRQQQR